MNGNLDIKDLKYFIAVARELHFGRAATGLSIAQPALSQHVRQLETKIGTRLLERSTRKVQLTPAGVVFLRDAERILMMMGEAVTSAQIAAGHQISLLRIGIIYAVAFRFLPMVIERFRRRYPDAKIEIDVLRTREILIGLEKGDLHIGLLRPPERAGQIRFVNLFRERFVAAVPADHRLAGAASLTVDDLHGESLVRLHRPDLQGSFQDLEQLFRQRGIKFRNDCMARNTFAALALTAAGAGITLLPEWIRGMPPWQSVVIKDVDELDIGIDLAVGWREDTPNPRIGSFVNVAKQVASQASWSRREVDERAAATAA